MSVDMYVSSSQSQASSVAAICRQQKQGYEQLQRSINEFVVGSPQLQGAAYESAKQFFSAVLIPLSKGGILLSEAVMEACQKFPEEYMANVDSGDLRESDLREKIEQMKRQMSELSHLQDRLQSMLFRQQQEGALDGSIASRMSSTHSLMATYGRVKQKLEEKLDDLLKFDASSPDIFVEIKVLEHAVAQGSAQVAQSWNSGSGTFNIPSSDKMAWLKSINKKWEERQEKHKIPDQYEVVQVDIGLYQVFKNGELDRDATKAYNELKAEEFWDNLVNGFSRAVDIADQLSFLIGNTIKIVGGGIGTITGIIGMTGGFVVVELATGGTATVALPSVILANGAIATAGGAIVLDGVSQLQNGYPGNIMFSNNGKITSKTFGKPIEGRVNGKKSKIRVDAEPDGNKIQIQSGGGKKSPLDRRIDISKITDRSSIYKLIDKDIQRNIGKGKVEELVDNIWKAYIWLVTK